VQPRVVSTHRPPTINVPHVQKLQVVQTKQRGGINDKYNLEDKMDVINRFFLIARIFMILIVVVLITTIIKNHAQNEACKSIGYKRFIQTQYAPSLCKDYDGNFHYIDWGYRKFPYKVWVKEISVGDVRTISPKN